MSTRYATHLVAFDTGYEAARDLLRHGVAIAFPTDTVYGVGAAGLDGEAVAQLFDIKARPLSQPIPLLLADPEQLSAICAEIPPLAEELARRYWPGALTIVVPALPTLPSQLLAGGHTVAVRVPAHAGLRRLIGELRQPLAATSANLHGRPNPRTARDVWEQLDGRVPLILDDGPTPGDIPSTIVDLSTPVPRILRQGVVKVAF